VRHPNYFLNVIPELIGLTFIMGAWLVLAIGLPLFLIVLGIRIAQEERVMKTCFPDGATLSFPPRNLVL
jgi:isoprenylcysteine carboxyl methyltransferase (ICMT) family protein YpbQ